MIVLHLQMFRKCDLELKEHAVCKEKVTRCFFWQRTENDVDEEDDSLYGACVSPLTCTS